MEMKPLPETEETLKAWNKKKKQKKEKGENQNRKKKKA
jgi:hypothetical protein